MSATRQKARLRRQISQAFDEILLDAESAEELADLVRGAIGQLGARMTLAELRAWCDKLYSEEASAKIVEEER